MSAWRPLSYRDLATESPAIFPAALLDPRVATPETDGLIACCGQPEMTDHQLACGIVHDRMLTRRLALDGES